MISRCSKLTQYEKNLASGTASKVFLTWLQKLPRKQVIKMRHNMYRRGAKQEQSQDFKEVTQVIREPLRTARGCLFT